MYTKMIFAIQEVISEFVERAWLVNGNFLSNIRGNEVKQTCPWHQSTNHESLIFFPKYAVSFDLVKVNFHLRTKMANESANVSV